MKRLRHIVVSPSKNDQRFGNRWISVGQEKTRHPMSPHSLLIVAPAWTQVVFTRVSSSLPRVARSCESSQVADSFGVLLLRFDSSWLKWELFFESLPFIIIIIRCFFFSKNELIEQNTLLANFMLFSLFCWQDGSNTDILDLIGSCIADIVQQVRRQSLSSRLIRTAAGLKLWVMIHFWAIASWPQSNFNFQFFRINRTTTFFRKDRKTFTIFVVLKWKKHT